MLSGQMECVMIIAHTSLYAQGYAGRKCKK